MFPGRYAKLWASCSSPSTIDCIYKNIRVTAWQSASFLPYLLIRLEPYERFQHLYSFVNIQLYTYISFSGLKLKSNSSYSSLYSCKNTHMYIYNSMSQNQNQILPFILIHILILLSNSTNSGDYEFLEITWLSCFKKPPFFFSLFFLFFFFFSPQPHFLTLHINQAHSIVPHTLVMEFNKHQ